MKEINPSNGFCSKTKIYHSLRPQVILPPTNQPLSASEYAISLLRSSSLSLENTIAFIDSSTGTSLSYSDFIKQTESLSFSLHNRFGLKRGDTAFILSSTSLQIPILYFSLLSLGVIVSPANPISTIPEISRQISLVKPVIGFSTSVTSNKLPSFHHGTVLLDSLDFKSMLTIQQPGRVNVQVVQTDTAAILYSSGTTGLVKGVELTHRNFIAFTAGHNQVRLEMVEENQPHPIGLFTIPLFHVFGFCVALIAVALGETAVLMDRFDFEGMLKAVETYKVTYVPVSPPLVVAMAKLDLVDKFDLSSLLVVACGGAPLGYVGDDEATVATLDSEGWLKTGDLCNVDNDGFLYIVDRLKELIKYKAYQVPPAELEHLLQTHLEIADVAVVPYPDEEAGQIPMAFVVRKPGSNLTGIQVMEFVAKQVAPYKKIRRVAFVSSIPKSAAGKISRKELIDSIQTTPLSKL
ncbi:4-coumarate--CoA ligase-like [Thalictrum thalictroides]|uniref:4-coumarate--CoA ligase-like n=1 Tax=Thalictrum thalictroides TaxID=46969 RepID=A0A7J6V4L9_THATH|nr:4-coumarate--CoA ligase-like [Thalictrum thalictroides]